MRVILDTNLLISALLSNPAAPPPRLVDAWRHKQFHLISSETQIEEIRRVSRLSKVHKRIAASEAGSLINHLRTRSELVTPVPGIDASPDPGDNFLLGMTQAGAADYLVSGDKRHVLDLENWQGTHISHRPRDGRHLETGPVMPESAKRLSGIHGPRITAGPFPG